MVIRAIARRYRSGYVIMQEEIVTSVNLDVAPLFQYVALLWLLNFRQAPRLLLNEKVAQISSNV
jgi:hypothetical protein